jgi:hypothetical protein
MTVHMGTAPRMLRVSTFPEPLTVPWTARTPRMCILDWTSYDIYFLWLDTAGRAKTRRTPAQPQYRISDSPDISLNDVSFTSMTVHMAVYAADRCYEFRRFLEPTTVPWILMPRTSTSRIWTKLQHTFFGWVQKYRRNQRNSRCQCDHRTEYSRRPVISFNDVSFTSMTAHGTVYAADKNVCFISWIPHDRQ